MKEKVNFLILLGLFVVIVSLAVYVLNDKEEENKFECATSNLNIENDIDIEEVNNMNNVMTVTSDNFESEVLKSDKKVVVDFYADWCGPCKMLSPIVEEVAGEIQDVKFVRLNVDDAQDIAINYGVMSIPTLVVIENGTEVKRSVGLISASEVKDLIK